MPDTVAPQTLYIVPTPLGNLADLTFRAVQVLREVDLVACEDTRRTLGLLNHCGISKPLWSYHAHSAPHRARQLLNALQSGKAVALVSDAGTPGLSDPGTLLVQAAIENQIAVVSLPGPCAAITALVGSGLPTGRVFFIGFLPRRKARAKRALGQGLATQSTVVIYESPFRVVSTLQLIQEIAGPRVAVVVARELTKIHEEFLRGTVQEILNQLEGRSLKGEVVILLNAASQEASESGE